MKTDTPNPNRPAGHRQARARARQAARDLPSAARPHIIPPEAEE